LIDKGRLSWLPFCFDKKEALDVVEDKLSQALAKVRPTEDFPNPILRLGKDVSKLCPIIEEERNRTPSSESTSGAAKAA